MTQRALFDQSFLSGQVADGEYRYLLWRSWSWGPKRLCFVLLNPSTADSVTNDPTVRRLIAFAQTWGFHGIDLVNIFALRSADPKALYRHVDPVGVRNDQEILAAAGRCTQVVCAWGNHGGLHRRGFSVAASLLVAGHELWCFRITEPGQPEHPLYQKRSATLRRFTLEDMVTKR